MLNLNEETPLDDSYALPPAEQLGGFWHESHNCMIETYAPAFEEAAKKYGRGTAIFGLLMAAYAFVLPRTQEFEGANRRATFDNASSLIQDIYERLTENRH